MQRHLKFSNWSRRPALTVCSGLLAISLAFAFPHAPALAQTNPQARPPQCQSAPPKKKKGFGLGGLLGATQGMGRILGSGIMGGGGMGQIAGAVVGTAIDAASTASRSAAQAEAATPSPLPCQGTQVATTGAASTGSSSVSGAANPTAASGTFVPRPGLGPSKAAPVGKPFALPLGLELRQPIKYYDSSRPQNCGNKDRSKAYGTDGNLIALCLVFSNKTKAPISVTFPPGFIFVSRRLETQNGILVQSVTITVPPTQAFYAPILLYCANGNRHGNGSGDLHDLGPVVDAPEFQALFRKLQAKDLLADTGQLIQGLVWSLGNDGEISSLLEPGIEALPARSR